MKQYAVIHAVAGLFEGYSDTTCEFFPKRSFADKHILQQFEHVGWRHRAELIANLEDHRLRQLGQRLIYWNAPAYVSDHYVEAAHAAIRDRWSSKDPDAPWMTIVGVEKQLDEIDEADALSEDKLNALRCFYDIRARSY